MHSLLTVSEKEFYDSHNHNDDESRNVIKSRGNLLMIKDLQEQKTTFLESNLSRMK